MSDRTRVLDAVTRLFWLTDHHRWDELTSVLAPEVRLDYTSLQGGEPSRLAPAEVVAAWETTLGGLDAHQHLLTNHLITVAGGRADVTSAFQATHQFDGETWTLGGDYAFELVNAGGAWLITSITMTAVWQSGDPELLSRAAGSA